MRRLVEARSRLPRSGIREIHDLAAQLSDVVKLHIGEPDATTPEPIIEAAAAAAKAGFTHYTPNAGLPSLRALIAERVRDRYMAAVTPEQVVVTTGGVTALASALMAIADPGDEVLIPDPGWPNYEGMILNQGSVPKRYTLAPETGFLPDVEELARLCGPKTRAIVVNSPANPTGAVFPSDVVEQLVRFAEQRGVYLVSDEVYDEIVFDASHTSPLSFGSPFVISVYSFSKTYAMTGWRVGYVVAPPDVSDLVGKLQELLVSCASAVSQKAAEAALTGSQEFVAVMRERYRQRRDRATEQMVRAGIPHVKPSGAFYAMLNLAAATDAPFPPDVAIRLLRDYGVAVAPGSTFGPSAVGMVRICLATADADIEEGLRRIARFTDDLRNGRLEGVTS